MHARNKFGFYEPISQRLRFILMALCLMMIVGVGAWLFPRALGLYYQLQGGKLLDQAWRPAEIDALSALVCSLSPVDTEPERALLQQAILNLQKSVRYNQQATHSYLLLGRAYCRLGNPQNAIENYQEYVKRRSDNPLGHLELGFAYEAECRAKAKRDDEAMNTNTYGMLCSDSIIRALIASEWKESGVVAGTLLELADQAFEHQDFDKAVAWYDRAAFLGSLSRSGFFKWGVASVVANHSLPKEVSESGVITPVYGSTQIEAQNLQWMRSVPSVDLDFGDQLSRFPSNNPSLGVMWWSGPAVTFVQIPKESTYEIKIRVADTPPGPIALEVEKNFFPIDRFTLSKGDNSWHELRTATVLPEGLNLIAIRFMDDTGDVYLDWIRLNIK